MSLRPFFTRLFTPAARRLTGVNPNVLSLLAIGAGAAAGASFAVAQGRSSLYALATLFVAVSGAADALDGMVARLSGRVSKTGELLDHIGDRLIDIFVLGGICLIPGAHAVLGVVTIVLALLFAYLGTQIEATFGVRSYAGAGKDEHVVGILAFGVALTIASLPAIQWPYAAWLPDVFFGIVIAVTIPALIDRFRRARALGQQADAGSPERVARG